MSPFLRLVVVLVSMDNPESLKVTLDSLGNLKYPNTILINIDSSYNYECKETFLASPIESQYFWEEKQGIYHAMNSALDLTQSEDIIWFLNPGDILNDPILLLDIMRTFQKDSTIDFIYAQAQEIANNDPLEIFPDSNAIASVTTLSEGTFRISHQALLVRSSIMKLVQGFDIRYKIAADLKLEFQLLSNYKGIFIPGTLICFESSGISHKRIVRTLIESACVRYFGGHLSLNKTFAFIIKSFSLKVKNRILNKESRDG